MYWSLSLSNKSVLNRWLFSMSKFVGEKPLSVTNNSVVSRSAAAGHVGKNNSAHVARRGRWWTDAVHYNWNWLKISLHNTFGTIEYWIRSRGKFCPKYSCTISQPLMVKCLVPAMFLWSINWLLLELRGKELLAKIFYGIQLFKNLKYA